MTTLHPGTAPPTPYTAVTTAAGSATVSVRGLSHWYGSGSMERQVLQGIDLEIHPGEVVLLTGPSGCGKTTLLTLVGALRQVMEGSVRVLGCELKDSSRH